MNRETIKCIMLLRILFFSFERMKLVLVADAQQVDPREILPNTRIRLFYGTQNGHIPKAGSPAFYTYFGIGTVVW